MTASSGRENPGPEHLPVFPTGTGVDGGVAAPAASRTRPGPRGRSRRPGGSTWRVPTALIALTVIPVIAGSLRLLELAGGPVLLPTNPRIDASPTPVVVHVVAVTLFALLGAFQFSTRLRRRRPGWHRRSGRVLVVTGLGVAGSGLWMTLFYAGAPGGYLLWAVRLLVGSAMAASIVLAFTAIRRRDIPTHRAWMIRAYALAAGAGTQLFTQGISEPVFGTGDLPKALSMTSGWLINIAIAELIIRRPARRRGRRAADAQTRALMVGSP
ncbi:DUF2306 domain-containing protein [Actinopolymorpha pittospori]|uniref:Membrane protein n=1 Tax=Actinopolymorpha pittospori TaxID=648752 RepID=A0A927RHL8_9ACTN|nr:DUF2306 domain-containing protein [Actinopolymorpha pittospori]MBE1603603.1 putative membrane protein [Actinopolymorpha pittospori]